MKLIGKGAERRLVVLKGVACTSQCNCACSLARLFLHFSKTTSTMEQFQRDMNMNVNIPPHPTPPHHQTKTEKQKKTKDNKTPRRPAAPMATNRILIEGSLEAILPTIWTVEKQR